MNSLYSELQWLLRAPKDFSDRLKALANSPGPLGRELQSLALHPLDLNQLTNLARAIERRAQTAVARSACPVSSCGSQQRDDRPDGPRTGGQRRAPWHRA